MRCFKQFYFVSMNLIRLVCGGIFLISTHGCSVPIYTRIAPTIAHVHIGHVITGWRDTPGKEGLFVLAETLAAKSLSLSSQAVKPVNSLSEIKQSIHSLIETIGDDAKKGSDKPFGMKQALTDAVGHIVFASESEDASANVRASVSGLAEQAAFVIQRCDLIIVLANDILLTDSPDEIHLLTQEVNKLVIANHQGQDLDEDGVVGSNPEEIGIQQLRQLIDAIIEREDPPYKTVDTWYLFNLIRLPSGQWVFNKWFDGGSSGGY